jgi:hypothetical protein
LVDDVELVDGGRITKEKIGRYRLCDVPVPSIGAGFMQSPDLKVSRAVAVRLRLPHYMVSMDKQN